MEQHASTDVVVSGLPITDLKWVMICVAMMYPINPDQKVFDLLQEPQHHSLLLTAGSPPAWKPLWVRSLPLIGWYLDLYVSTSFLRMPMLIRGNVQAASSIHRGVFRAESFSHPEIVPRTCSCGLVRFHLLIVPSAKWRVLRQCYTKYEDVTDFLADDLEQRHDDWAGKKVGMFDRTRSK